MKKFLGIAMLCATAACGTNPIAPDEHRVKLDPMAQFAALHAHELCILGQLFDGSHYYDVGILIPMTSWRQGYTLMPISYCNPAE